MIAIRPGLEIPEHELRFTTSRSAGPGGQNVNKVESRVTLHFDVLGSPSLGEVERARLLDKLATRINKHGVLQLHAQEHRSQSANREALVERFAQVLRAALARRRPRRPTAPTKASRQRRLSAKRHRGAVKRTRGSPGGEE